MAVSHPIMIHDAKRDCNLLGVGTAPHTSHHVGPQSHRRKWPRQNLTNQQHRTQHTATQTQRLKRTRYPTGVPRSGPVCEGCSLHFRHRVPPLHGFGLCCHCAQTRHRRSKMPTPCMHGEPFGPENDYACGSTSDPKPFRHGNSDPGLRCAVQGDVTKGKEYRRVVDYEIYLFFPVRRTSS